MVERLWISAPLGAEILARSGLRSSQAGCSLGQAVFCEPAETGAVALRQQPDRRGQALLGQILAFFLWGKLLRPHFFGLKAKKWSA